MNRHRPIIHGVVVVDKPAGATSAQVVERVRRYFGGRAGHTGTLDPMATGVLPICLNEATKLAPFLQADDKAYDAEITLGVTTDTLDRDGTVIGTAPVTAGEAEIRAALAGFRGEQLQTPPMYSAIKVQGRRLHHLAREGADVDRAPRAIVVHDLELVDLDLPRFRIRVSCSKGTYVRSLADDLGRTLGCGAHLSQLRRTRCGRFSLAQAVPVHLLATAQITSLADALEFPEVRVSDADAHRIVSGIVPPHPELENIKQSKILDESGRLVAIVSRRGSRLVIDRAFLYGLTNAPSPANLPAVRKP